MTTRILCGGEHHRGRSDYDSRTERPLGTTDYRLILFSWARKQTARSVPGLETASTDESDVEKKRWAFKGVGFKPLVKSGRRRRTLNRRRVPLDPTAFTLHPNRC